jgi:hypothetical protein
MNKHANNEARTVTEAEATTETVAQCERVLAELGQRRDRLHERLGELERERGQVAYAAHTGDGAAGKLLDKTIAETVKHSEHVKALDDAIAEAGRRLAAAREHEARAADKQKARELSDVLAAFLQCARRLDATLVTVAEHGNKLHDLQAQMHMLGAAVPNLAQLDSLGARSLLTAIAQTPWRRHFETLAPHERRSFTELCAYWGQTLQRNIASRLGEQITDEQTKTEPEVAA